MLTFPTYFVEDTRGTMAVLEFSTLPEPIQRTYITTNVPTTATRGGHAHRRCKQYLQVIKGQCDVTMDNGTEKETIRLNPIRGILLVDTYTWTTVYNYSEDCVLMVYATLPYDESDYIRDYEVFKSELK